MLNTVPALHKVLLGIFQQTLDIFFILTVLLEATRREVSPLTLIRS